MPKIQRLSEEDRKLGKALAEHAKLDPSIVLQDYNIQSHDDTVTVIFEVFHKLPRIEFEALVASAKARNHDAVPAAVSEALEQKVADLLYVNRDYVWQIQARKVIELVRAELGGAL